MSSMKSLHISENKAYELYPKASDEFKAMLEDTFGSKFFQRDITDRIQSFVDVCVITGTDQLSFIEGEPDEMAYRQLKLICKAYNGDWTPDWANSNELKYYPWFWMNPFGLRPVRRRLRSHDFGRRLPPFFPERKRSTARGDPFFRGL